MRVTFLTVKRIARGSMHLPLLLCCFYSATAHGAAASSQGEEMLENIRRTAAKFARELVDDANLHNVAAEAAALDSRLRLRECSAPLEAFATSNSSNKSRITVGVRCTTPNPWTLYVPVTITATTDVVYSTRAFARGELPQQADLEIRRVALDNLPAGYLSSMDQLQYMELARPIRSGAPLTLNALTTRDLVRQGQEVVIVAEGSGVQVKMTGKALKSGSAGDRILVQNSNSGRHIEATVLNDGTVRVDW